jgi:Domain of unknown function (DUF4261)
LKVISQLLRLRRLLNVRQCVPRDRDGAATATAAAAATATAGVLSGTAPKPNGSEDAMDRPMAFVLLDRPVAPDMAAVVAAIVRRHPGTPASVPGEAKPGQRNDSPLLLCAGEFVVVMSMPAPVPRDDGVIARAAAAWPQARATFDRHRAHLIVSTLGTSEHPLRLARPVTAVVGALIAAVPGCLGVVWGQVAHPAERWLGMSRAAFAPYPEFPFKLWVGIHPFGYGSSVGAVTSGLAAWVGREVEFEGDGLDLSKIVDKVAGLAAYLIERGSVIGDGETFGASGDERIQVHHAMSNRFSGLPVLLATAGAV